MPFAAPFTAPFTGVVFASEPLLRVLFARAVFPAEVVFFWAFFLGAVVLRDGSFSAARLTPASESSRRIVRPSEGLMPAIANASRSSARER